VQKTSPELEETNFGRQGSPRYIQRKLTELVQKADTPEQRSFIRTLEAEGYIRIDRSGPEPVVRDVNNIRIEEVVFRDSAEKRGELGSSGLRNTNPEEPRIDTLDIVNIGDVFDNI
jgi:hypothetical protein